MAQKALVLLAGALAVLVSCTSGSTVGVEVDLLSYIPPSGRSADAVVPVGDGLAVYLLPGVQIDDSGNGPNEEMQAGSLVQVDAVTIPPGADLTARITLRARMNNRSATETVSPFEVRLLVAPATSTDVYVDGTEVARAGSNGLATGASTTLTADAVLEQGSVGFESLASGSFRIGISIMVDPAPLALVPVSLELQEISVAVRIRPFGIVE